MATTAASANTIITGITQLQSGSVPSFTTPSSSTASAPKFDLAAANAYIAGACTAGYDCSGATLTNIDFTLNVTSAGSLQVVNTTTAVATIKKIGTGTNAVEGSADLVITDPLGIEAAEAISTFGIKANVTVAKKIGTVNGVRTFSGPGAGTATGTVDALTGDWSNSALASGNFSPGSIIATYVYSGLGSANVNFALNLSGLASTGALANGVTTANNTQSITGGRLGIVYTYQYTETIIPEPTTMGLIGIGLIGLGTLRKRSKN